MKLLLLAITIALALLPAPASADTTLCQPDPVGQTCATAYTDGGWAYLAVCNNSATTGTCVGGGHFQYPAYNYVGNSAGGSTCLWTAGVCTGVYAGQWSWSGYFVVEQGIALWTPAGGAGYLVGVGTYNGGPYESGQVCASSLATGGTCLLV